MDDYVERMINQFPMKMKKSDTALTPDWNIIFGKYNRKRLNKKESEQFHASVARGMFVSKRERSGIYQTIVVLSEMVK